MLSVRMPVHDVVESDRTNRAYSDMKCIFGEYLRLFAAREEHAVTRACDGKASAFMVSQACTSHMDQNQWPQDAILQEIAYATHCERLVHSHGMDLLSSGAERVKS